MRGIITVLGKKHQWVFPTNYLSSWKTKEHLKAYITIDYYWDASFHVFSNEQFLDINLWISTVLMGRPNSMRVICG